MLSRVTSSLKTLTQKEAPMEDRKDNRLKTLSRIRSLQQIQVKAHTAHFLNEGCCAGAMAAVPAICILLNVTILIGYKKVIFSFYVYVVSANCLSYVASYVSLAPVIQIY